MDKLREECGIVGILSKEKFNIANIIKIALLSLQHRGQESAGISYSTDRAIRSYKNLGLVQEALDDRVLEQISAKLAIGHVRYSTTGSKLLRNAQPVNTECIVGDISLAHNGNLVNATKLRKRLLKKGQVFNTTIDSEIFLNLIAINYKDTLKNALVDSLKQIRGSFAFVVMTKDTLIGIRDPYGLRPLAIARYNGGYILSSETCVFDILGAEFIRDVKKGEIVIIKDDKIESIIYDDKKPCKLCSFEYVYFARPDSNIDGVNVFKTRVQSGILLAKKDKEKYDLVAPVPDSGIPAAIGYSKEANIDYSNVLIKNKYVGRTFLKPTQKEREMLLRLKLNVVKENVVGKKIVLVDDSIVRGTTMRNLIVLLKNAGAKEVHVRISSPPVKYSCYFGIDTPSELALISATKTREEILKHIGADSLKFLEVDDLKKAIGVNKTHCFACFNGDYPMKVSKIKSKFVFEKD